VGIRFIIYPTKNLMKWISGVFASKIWLLLFLSGYSFYCLFILIR